MPVCIVCSTRNCETHKDWGRCEKHGSTFDLQIFAGCRTCLEEQGKEIYRPRLKEICSLCETRLKDDDEVYTDPTPSCVICLSCGRKHGLDKHNWPKVRVKIGRIWTAAEVKSEKFK